VFVYNNNEIKKSS